MAKRRKKKTTRRRPRRRRLRRNQTAVTTYFDELSQALSFSVWVTAGITIHKLGTAALANRVLDRMGPFKDGTENARFRPAVAAGATALVSVPLLTWFGTAAVGKPRQPGKANPANLMAAGAVSNMIYGLLRVFVFDKSPIQPYFDVNAPVTGTTPGGSTAGLGAYYTYKPHQILSGMGGMNGIDPSPFRLPADYPITSTPIDREGILSGRSGIF